MMTEIALPDQVVERLQQMASQKQINIAELLVRAVEFYLANDVAMEDEDDAWALEQKLVIDREMEAYLQQHEQLLTIYRGQSIAMHNGEVIDHDPDEVALSQRVRARYGKEPVLITPVLPEPIQTIFVRSPRLLME